MSKAQNRVNTIFDRSRALTASGAANGVFFHDDAAKREAHLPSGSRAER
jgi:hypothetical protein